MNFEDLAKEVQDYINKRASSYNRTGEELFNQKHIFPEEFNELNPNEMIEFLKYKDISHIYSQSKYPHLREDLDNIILEDSEVNIARRARKMTSEEKVNAVTRLVILLTSFTPPTCIPTIFALHEQTLQT